MLKSYACYLIYYIHKRKKNRIDITKENESESIK